MFDQILKSWLEFHEKVRFPRVKQRVTYTLGWDLNISGRNVTFDKMIYGQHWENMVKKTERFKEHIFYYVYDIDFFRESFKCLASSKQNIRSFTVFFFAILMSYFRVNDYNFPIYLTQQKSRSGRIWSVFELCFTSPPPVYRRGLYVCPPSARLSARAHNLYLRKLS